MSETLALRSEAPLAKIKSQVELPAEPYGSVMESVNSDFQLYLKRTLEREIGPSPPDEHEGEKLASAVGVGEVLSNAMRNGLNVDKVNSANIEIQAGMADLSVNEIAAGNSQNETLAEESEYPALNPQAHSVSEPQSEIENPAAIPVFGDDYIRADEKNDRLRELFLSGANSPGFWRQIQERFPSLNFLSENPNGSEGFWTKGLQSELANLVSFHFKNAFSGLKGDIWVQQIWPLPETQSIFNGSMKIDVPYNPNRDMPELPDKKEIANWEQEFEAGWASARAENLPVPDSNQPYQAVSENAQQAHTGSKESAFETVPGGEKLFQELVNRVKMNLEQGNYRMSLELHPEYLGRLMMKVSLKGDELEARFLVQNEAVRNLMLAKLGELKESLMVKGLSVKDIKVEVLTRTEVVPSSQSEYGAFPEEILSGISSDSPRIAYFHPEQTSLSNMWVV